MSQNNTTNRALSPSSRPPHPTVWSNTFPSSIPQPTPIHRPDRVYSLAQIAGPHAARTGRRQDPRDPLSEEGDYIPGFTGRSFGAELRSVLRDIDERLLRVEEVVAGLCGRAMKVEGVRKEGGRGRMGGEEGGSGEEGRGGSGALDQ